MKEVDHTEATKKYSYVSRLFRLLAPNDPLQKIPPPVEITCAIESPPVVFYGSHEESGDAFLAGQLCLRVTEDLVMIDSLTTTLSIHTTYKQPFFSDCYDCRHKYTTLKSWHMLTRPTTLHHGHHFFPFSTQIYGTHPASTDTPAVSISYEFKADAVINTCIAPSTTLNGADVDNICSTVKFQRIIPVKRIIPTPSNFCNSVRPFPPTDVIASATYNSIIHPNSRNKLVLKLDGLKNRHETYNAFQLWHLRQLTWKLEETTKAAAMACNAHPIDATNAQGGILVSKCSVTRVIGERQIYEGWNSDYSSRRGTVSININFGVLPVNATSNYLAYACDAKEQNGLDISHCLVIELIASKEFARADDIHTAIPAGTHRLFRMRFPVVLVEPPDMNESWDNEAPPPYQDLKHGPPEYKIEGSSVGHSQHLSYIDT